MMILVLLAQADATVRDHRTQQSANWLGSGSVGYCWQSANCLHQLIPPLPLGHDDSSLNREEDQIAGYYRPLLPVYRQYAAAAVD